MTAAPSAGSRLPAQDVPSTVSTLRVRYSETDRMGFVHHPNYLVWCEIARTDFIRKLGTTYAEVEDAGCLLAVTEVEIRYLAPARYDDLIEIRCTLDRVQSRSVTFSYEIVRTAPGPEKRLATAATRLIAIDRSGLPRTFPADLSSRFRDAAATIA
jgi:acyl-CoA thioester hydrolase